MQADGGVLFLDIDGVLNRRSSQAPNHIRLDNDLMERLRTLLPKGWALEVPAPEWVDGKEAIAFAWLALRTAQGKPTSLATVTGASEDVCGGVLFGTFATP